MDIYYDNSNIFTEHAVTVTEQVSGLPTEGSGFPKLLNHLFGLLAATQLFQKRLD